MTDGPPSPGSPLAGLRIALAGPGRVGTSLVHWATARGASLELVAGRTPERCAALAGDLGGRTVPLEALVSEGCDLLLVAVADPALDDVAHDLAPRPQAAVCLHTAGGRGAAALEPLATAGSAAGAFHPLKAFPEPLTSLDEAAGTFFALDGPAPALELGRRLADAFGGTAEVVPERLRPLYHLAASVAAGGVTTLVASTADLVRELGLPDAVALGYLELAAGALDRVRAAASTARDRTGTSGESVSDAMARAITGPVARGELDGFARRLEALRAAGPAGRRRVELFARLALETARLAPGARVRGDGGGGGGDEALEAALRRLGLGRGPDAPGFLDPSGREC
ncbi:MAG: DUF2520 domain-containing protein [Acidobacteriota bacterium]|jgi:predicted short-subunit dehydrogenase-like oxidoreductase (DUF2520 family)